MLIMLLVFFLFSSCKQSEPTNKYHIDIKELFPSDSILYTDTLKSEKYYLTKYMVKFDKYYAREYPYKTIIMDTDKTIYKCLGFDYIDFGQLVRRNIVVNQNSDYYSEVLNLFYWVSFYREEEVSIVRKEHRKDSIIKISFVTAYAQRDTIKATFRNHTLVSCERPKYKLNN